MIPSRQVDHVADRAVYQRGVVIDSQRMPDVIVLLDSISKGSGD